MRLDLLACPGLMWTFKLFCAVAKLLQKVEVMDCSGRQARQGKSWRRGKSSDLHVRKQIFILRRRLKVDFEHYSRESPNTVSTNRQC